MQVGIRVSREVIINGQIDTFDINATAKDIGSNADTFVEFLELLVSGDARLS